MFKAVELLYISVEIVKKNIFQHSLMKRRFKEIEIFCNIINVFTITFDQFNAGLQNKRNTFFQKNKNLLDPKMRNLKYILYKHHQYSTARVNSH